MILLPDPNNKSLIKVFYHDSSTGVWFNQDEMYYANSKYKLNLFGNITNKHKIGEYFEFVFEYPDLNFSWKQKKNIKDTEIGDNSQTIGYVGNGPGCFGGIIKSEFTSDSLYDGSPPDKYNSWWFSVGAKNSFSEANKFPGMFVSSTNHALANKVTIWMRNNFYYLKNRSAGRYSIYKGIFFCNILLIS